MCLLHIMSKYEACAAYSYHDKPWYISSTYQVYFNRHDVRSAGYFACNIVNWMVTSHLHSIHNCITIMNHTWNIVQCIDCSSKSNVAVISSSPFGVSPQFHRDDTLLEASTQILVPQDITWTSDSIRNSRYYNIQGNVMIDPKLCVRVCVCVCACMYAYAHVHIKDYYPWYI